MEFGIDDSVVDDAMLLIFLIDDFATDAIAALVRAMDVSWSEAQRAETNVIAPTSHDVHIRNHCAVVASPSGR
jgi:hypothetical protein